MQSFDRSLPPSYAILAQEASLQSKTAQIHPYHNAGLSSTRHKTKNNFSKGWRWSSLHRLFGTAKGLNTPNSSAPSSSCKLVQAVPTPRGGFSHCKTLPMPGQPAALPPSTFDHTRSPSARSSFSCQRCCSSARSGFCILLRLNVRSTASKIAKRCWNLHRCVIKWLRTNVFIKGASASPFSSWERGCILDPRTALSSSSQHRKQQKILLVHDMTRAWHSLGWGQEQACRHSKNSTSCAKTTLISKAPTNNFSEWCLHG